jgi:hypothetical protein
LLFAILKLEGASKFADTVNVNGFLGNPKIVGYHLGKRIRDLFSNPFTLNFPVFKLWDSLSGWLWDPELENGKRCI